MKCPWSVAEEMEEYAKKHAFVSSACRLTTEEEMLLLQLCSPDARGRLSLTLLNRKAFVTAVSSLATLPKDKSLTVKLGTERPPSIDNFDIGPDTTILDNPKKTMLTSKFFGAAYSRPEEVRYDEYNPKLCTASSRISHKHQFVHIGPSCIWRLEGSRIHQFSPNLWRRVNFLQVWFPFDVRSVDEYRRLQTSSE